MPSGYSYALSAASGTLSLQVSPVPPTGLSATASDGQVALTWNASTGATSYTLLRSTTSGGTYTVVASGLSATNYADTTVTNATTYYYVLQAASSGGVSANSTQVSATPLSAYQQWLVSNNLSATLTNTATPDGDGISILMKYATAMTPGTPSATGPTLLSETNNALTIQFNRLSPAPVTYSVEASTDLATWTNIATLTNGADIWTGNAAITEIGSNPRSVIVTDPVIIGSTPTRFLRLQVTGGN
jgi:cellulose 1,4-beta-cellobiosidase